MKERNPAAHDTGFTLIELIIVVIVIAVIAAIAVPLYNGFQDRARQTAVDESVKSVHNAVLQETVHYGGNGNDMKRHARTYSEGNITYDTTRNAAGQAICVVAYDNSNPEIRAEYGGACGSTTVTASCSISGNRITISFQAVTVNDTLTGVTFTLTNANGDRVLLSATPDSNGRGSVGTHTFAAIGQHGDITVSPRANSSGGQNPPSPSVVCPVP